MVSETSPGKQELKALIKSEIPSLSNKELDAILSEIGNSRSRFSRYDRGKKSARRGYTYAARRRSGYSILLAAHNLLDSLQNADLMVLDDLDQHVGDAEFRAELHLKLSELKTASIAIYKSVPANVSGGRQLDLILYDWVIEMANIYEGVFRPRRAHHSKTDKFTRFLKCWKPDGIPEYGDKLSPRYIKRILAHRERLKQERWSNTG
jgi:hypothetical protein